MICEANKLLKSKGLLGESSCNRSRNKQALVNGEQLVSTFSHQNEQIHNALKKRTVSNFIITFVKPWCAWPSKGAWYSRILLFKRCVPQIKKINQAQQFLKETEFLCMNCVVGWRGVKLLRSKRSILGQSLRQTRAAGPQPPQQYRQPQSKAARARYKRRWRAPCTVGQRNVNVLNLSKGTFKNLVKIREPSISFNFAESQQKMSFEHNKGIDGTGNWHTIEFFFSNVLPLFSNPPPPTFLQPTCKFLLNPKP